MKKEFLIDGQSFFIESAEDVSVGLSKESESEGVSFYRISFDWGRTVSPKKISLYYEIPAVDMYYMWDPMDKVRDKAFSFRSTESRLPWGMPLKAMVSRDSKNAYLLSLSDVKTPVSLKMRCSQYRPMIPVEIDFFTMLCGPFERYETVIRIDRRRVPFYQAIYDAVDWFAELGYKNGHVPEAALRPMYSTWYSYTQSISAEAALRECREAVRYGMDTVIIDDGWHTRNYDSLYGHCGDWEPDRDKFPDMKGFVDSVHGLGMKAMLWYATPFIGVSARAREEFEGMFLGFAESCQCYYLDPRYKKVRDFLVGVFSHALRDWGFDGLKLDFINNFKTNGEYNSEMDTVSVEDATELLLAEVSAALREIDPDVLIEFRQPYFGPVVSTYGNMMRVWDCPLDGCCNRAQTVNLRLVSGECAVHSDMMYWHPEDSDESVAIQLWGTVFSVPQISARMEELTESHGRVLRRYLDFWNRHRDTLMRARLRATLCENGYGTVSAVRDGESITLLADTAIYEYTGEADVAYAVNITDSQEIIVKCPDGRGVECEVVDCRGDRVGERITLKGRLNGIYVPAGGMLCMRELK